MTPRIRPGSILRHAADGRRYVVKAIHKVETQPHTGFSQIFGLEPQPEPLQPHRQQPIRTTKKPRKKPRRNPRWFR
jgi:hypothetical protein